MSHEIVSTPHDQHASPQQWQSVQETLESNASGVALLQPDNSADIIRQNAEQLIDDINKKRKQDVDLLNDFRKSFNIGVRLKKYFSAHKFRNIQDIYIYVCPMARKIHLYQVVVLKLLAGL